MSATLKPRNSETSPHPDTSPGTAQQGHIPKTPFPLPRNRVLSSYTCVVAHTGIQRLQCMRRVVVLFPRRFTTKGRRINSPYNKIHTWYKSISDMESSEPTTSTTASSENGSIPPPAAAPKAKTGGPRRRDPEYIAHLTSLPADERYRANVASYIEDRRKIFEAKDHYCVNCWLTTMTCMCKDAKPIPSFHRYIIYMHHKGSFEE